MIIFMRQKRIPDKNFIGPLSNPGWPGLLKPKNTFTALLTFLLYFSISFFSISIIRADKKPRRPLSTPSLRVLWGPTTGNIKSLAVDSSGNSKLAAVGVEGGEIFLFDITSGVIKDRLRTKKTPRELVFAGPNTLIALDRERKTTEYNLNTPASTQGKDGSATIANGKTASTMALHPSKELILFGTAQGSMEIHHKRSGVLKFRLQAHEAEIKAIRFIKRKNLMVSVDTSGAIVLWRWHREGSPLQVRRTTVPAITCMSEIRMNVFLLGHKDGSISRLQVPSLKTDWKKPLFHHSVVSVFLQSKKTWAASSEGGGWLWMSPTGPTPLVTRNDRNIYFSHSLPFKTLFVADGRVIRVYDTARKARKTLPTLQADKPPEGEVPPQKGLSLPNLTLERKVAAHPLPVAAAVHHPEKPWVFTAGEDGSLSIWDIDESRLLYRRYLKKTRPLFLSVISSGWKDRNRKKWQWVLVGRSGKIWIGNTNKAQEPTLVRSAKSYNPAKRNGPVSVKMRKHLLSLLFSNGNSEVWNLKTGTRSKNNGTGNKNNGLETSSIFLRTKQGWKIDLKDSSEPVLFKGVHPTAVVNLYGLRSFILATPNGDIVSLTISRDGDESERKTKGLLRLLSRTREKPTLITTDPQKERLIMGTQSGSLLVWQIEKAKHRELKSYKWPMHKENKGSRQNRTPSGGTKSSAPAQISKYDKQEHFSGGRLMRGPEKKRINSLSFIDGGARLVAGVGDGTIKIYDAKKWRKINQIRAHLLNTSWVRSCRGGSRLVSGDVSGTLRMWDTKYWKPLWTTTFHRGGIWESTCSPDGVTLASVGEDGSINLWDIDSGSLKRTPRNPSAPLSDGKFDNSRALNAVAFHPSLPIVFTGGVEGRVMVFDTVTGKRTSLIKSTVSAVMTMVFVQSSHTRFLLAVGTADGMVRLYRTKDWAEQKTFSAGRLVRNLHAAPGEPALIVSYKNKKGGNVGLFHVPDGHLLRSFSIRPSPGKLSTGKDWRIREQTPVMDAVSLSPDGSSAAGGSENGYIWIWKMR